ncbi:Mur ligase family protein [Steroidobacter denitrificans]|nr:UDP-N-acetylmuramoyl-L-alanyl-D-glutamate--2,6-diaminopimelate ligase [Steroidobacter denitrificans]
MTLDSRAVRPGSAFVALAGARTHGIRFAAQAAQAGARAILWEPSAAVTRPRLPAGTALIAVPDLAESLGDIADRFFDSPSADLRVAGITGTNGKTTTAHVLAQALAGLGESSAYAGTLGVGRMIPGPAFAGEAGGGMGKARQMRYDYTSTTHTTPDCITVHRRLAELRNAGTRFLGMEVSSHALDQHRVAGVRFDTAVFTNLTHDHLDYHGSLAAYGAAKARLFSWPGLKYAVINVDDEFGRSLSRRALQAQLVFYSRRDVNIPAALATNPDPRVAVFAATAASQIRELHGDRVSAAPSGLVIDVDGSWGAHELRCGFIGDFNTENLLAVLGTLLAWGIPPAEAIAALGRCTAPPGRMEVLGAAGQVKTIIDYAHTPAALEKALRAARGHCTGTLTCVFGCGGERDIGKRPLMARIAENLADAVIVTDDNPRGEDGDAIIADILKGFARPGQVVIERNRAAAIAGAIRGGKAGDMVLIAGKGHEDYQIIGARRYYFSDRAVACAALDCESGTPGSPPDGDTDGAEDGYPGERPGVES